MPLFRSMHGDRAGSVWLGEYDIGRSSASVYNVVSAAGEWLGPVRFPREIRILDITEARVLGVEQDELDVESIVVYKLEESTP